MIEQHLVDNSDLTLKSLFDSPVVIGLEHSGMFGEQLSYWLGNFEEIVES